MKLWKSNHTKLLPHLKQKNIAKRLPEMCFVDSGIVRTHSNILFATLKVDGVNIATASNDEINYFDNTLHNLITSLDDSMGVVGHIMRRKMPMSFTVKVYSNFTKNFNKKYLKQFEDAQLYFNDIYFTLYHRKLAEALKDRKTKFFGKIVGLFKVALFGKQHKNMVDFELSKAKQELAEMLYRFQSQLGHIKTKNQTTETKFFAHRLDESNEHEFSEMMGFLGSFLNGLDNIKYAYPNDPMYEFKDLAESSVQDRIDEFPSYSKFPHGNLSEYLSNQEINFGEKRYFAFEDSKKIANMISSKRYATAMSAISLHELFKVDAEMICTVSFLPIERAQARKKVNKVVTAMNVTNDGGETELAKLETLEDDVLSEQITLGASHVSPMVLSSTKEDLKEKTNQVQRVFGEESFDFQAYMKFGLDTTKLLKEKRLTGIITLYVFHLIMMVIERGDGKPTGLIFDEGWSYLQDPYFASELNEVIPTLRKVNTFIILATQSASSVINCPIKDIILSNMEFIILAPNSQANYQDVYQHLNISQSEFNWIKRTPVQTRQALYKQPMSNDSAIVDLGLKGFGRELAVISGSTESVAIKRKVIEDLGTNDPGVWLSEFYKRMGV